jgi:hypothetical protein
MVIAEGRWCTPPALSYGMGSGGTGSYVLLLMAWLTVPLGCVRTRTITADMTIW